jgi:hypothetical protein
MSSGDGIAYDEHSEYPRLVMGMELDEWFDFGAINPDSKIGVRLEQHIAKKPLQKRSAENATKGRAQGACVLCHSRFTQDPSILITLTS